MKLNRNSIRAAGTFFWCLCRWNWTVRDQFWWKFYLRILSKIGKYKLVGKPWFLPCKCPLSRYLNFSWLFKMIIKVWPSVALMKNWFPKDFTTKVSSFYSVGSELFLNPFNANVPFCISLENVYRGLEMGQWHWMG